MDLAAGHVAALAISCLDAGCRRAQSRHRTRPFGTRIDRRIRTCLRPDDTAAGRAAPARRRRGLLCRSVARARRCWASCARGATSTPSAPTRGDGSSAPAERTHPRHDRALIGRRQAMERFYTALNRFDAYLLLHRLQHAGISAHVFNEHASSIVGEVPPDVAQPQVWLDERTRPAARGSGARRAGPRARAIGQRILPLVPRGESGELRAVLALRRESLAPAPVRGANSRAWRRAYAVAAPRRAARARAPRRRDRGSAPRPTRAAAAARPATTPRRRRRAGQTGRTTTARSCASAAGRTARNRRSGRQDSRGSRHRSSRRLPARALRGASRWRDRRSNRQASDSGRPGSEARFRAS